MPLSTDAVALWMLSHGIRILFVVVAFFITRSALHAIIGRLERLVQDEDPGRLSEAEKRAQTLGRILRSTATVLLAVMGTMMILREIGMDIGPLIAGAGVAGIAVGFGAQSLVKDVITGFFILLEDQVRVGDVVQAGGVSGLVESMNLRTIVLRDLDGRVHVVPNGEIKIVSNLTKGWSRAVIDLGIGMSENVDDVVRLLKEIGEAMRREPQFATAMVEPVEVYAIEGFGESDVKIRMLAKTLPLRQWDVGRELRRRIKIAFDERGIEIPYPHRVVVVSGGSGAGAALAPGAAPVEPVAPAGPAAGGGAPPRDAAPPRAS